jgi:hypothetical protein
MKQSRNHILFFFTPQCTSHILRVKKKGKKLGGGGLIKRFIKELSLIICTH